MFPAGVAVTVLVLHAGAAGATLGQAKLPVVRHGDQQHVVALGRPVQHGLQPGPLLRSQAAAGGHYQHLLQDQVELSVSFVSLPYT